MSLCLRDRSLLNSLHELISGDLEDGFLEKMNSIHRRLLALAWRTSAKILGCSSFKSAMATRNKIPSSPNNNISQIRTYAETSNTVKPGGRTEI